MTDKTPPFCERDGKPCPVPWLKQCVVDPCRPVAPDSLVARLRDAVNDKERCGGFIDNIGDVLMEEAADRLERATELLRRHEGHDPEIRKFLDAIRHTTEG